MALHGRSKLASSLSFCVLVLTVMIRPISSGICASAVTSYGYKCLELEVQTKDGFILSIQRIPEGRGGGGDKRREPVLLQHGILVDSLTWLINQPEQNLPMILADEGYDVWISNSRGTRFSSRHTSLRPDQPEYWNWTWQELTEYDLPAIFDYIHNQTQQKIHYVGHSQGTLIAMAALSEGLLVDKMKSAALLSPIAYINHMKSALAAVGGNTDIPKLFGDPVFDPKGLFPDVAEAILKECNVISNCYDLLDPITGKNCCLNTSTADLFFKDEPQPTAYKNILHYGQCIRSGTVAKFNYGDSRSNIQHYGVPNPPVYNLTRIPNKLPILLSYGLPDLLSVVQDVDHLLDTLKSHDSNQLDVQCINDYAHMDFIMATNAKDVVYNRVVSFFKNHTDS